MRRVLIFLGLLLSSLIQSCGSLSSLNSGDLTGSWKIKQQKVYLIDSSDINIYFADTNLILPISATENKITHPQKLHKQSFDLDVVYIPVKLRFQQDTIPTQISSNLNAQIYLGLRWDFSNLSYQKLMSNRWLLQKKHFAISTGLVFGVGGTSISYYNTKNKYSGQYDGIVLTSGVSTILAYKNLTFGGSLCIDQLTNQHKNVWIYQKKPYFGLVVGLNIN